MDINIKPLDTVAEVAKEFIQKVITPPLEEVGQLMADKVKLWRFKNQVKVITKADEYLKEKNIKTRKVSLKVMAPLLESCSLEEDEGLQEKWSALLVNTVSEGSDIETTLYLHILSQLSKVEAELFEYLYNHSTKKHVGLSSTIVIKENYIIDVSGLRQTRKDFDLHLDNLLRLRLIKEIQTHSIDILKISLTDLGFRFMGAVSQL